MSQVTVQLVSYEPNKEFVSQSGNPYKATSIGVKSHGSVSYKNFMAQQLMDNPTLMAKIQTLPGLIGSYITLVKDDNDKFKRIVDILQATEAEFLAEEAKPAPQKKSFGGNPKQTARAAAINAASRLGKTADEVIALADRYFKYITQDEVSKETKAEAHNTPGASVEVTTALGQFPNGSVNVFGTSGF